MFLLKKLLTAWLLPPFGLLVAVVVLCLAARRKSVGLVAASLTAMTISLALPAVSEWLSASIESFPVISAQQLNSAQAIVILGGGIHYGAAEYGSGDTVSKFSLARLRYGAKLARESRLPVLVTGGVVYGGTAEAALMKQVLEREFGIPVRWAEMRSRNTAENAHYSAAMLKADKVERIALVTHASHMARAKGAFEDAGMTVIPAPTDFAPQGTPMFERFLPSTGSFERSALVLREWIALLVQSR